MIVPVQMALVPLLTLFRDLGIANGFGGIWLAHTAFGLPLGIFLLRNFFITLPRDLIEAARVDGASNLRIFLKVVIPLSVPALAAFGIFQFLWVWNDLLMAFIFIQNGDLLPMTVRINQMQSTYGGEWHLLSAGAFLLMIVPLIVFFALAAVLRPGIARRLGQIAAPVHLVPHTHWDREWYLPFQRFRLKLVRLVDGAARPDGGGRAVPVHARRTACNARRLSRGAAGGRRTASGGWSRRDGSRSGPGRC